jgi:hypothetical protein
MEIVSRKLPWQKGLKLRCSKKHTFYVIGAEVPIGSPKSPVAYVRCPKCQERVAGGEYG